MRSLGTAKVHRRNKHNMPSSMAPSIVVVAALAAASSVQPVAAFGPTRTPPTSISHRATGAGAGTGAAPPLHMMRSTGDYLSSLSPLLPDAPAGGQSASQVYLNGLSNFAEWSSSPADVVASPEQYLASLSSTFAVAAADADAVGAMGDAVVGGGAAAAAAATGAGAACSLDLSSQLSGGFDFGDFASDISETLASVTDGSGEALTALFGKAGDALRYAPQIIYDGAEKAGSVVRAGTGDASLLDLANGVLKGLAIVGGVLAKILDALLQTFAGTSVGQIVAGAQASVQGILDGAVNTVTSLGNVTLKEAVQALVTLFIASVKVLFSVLSAVIKIASDKGVDDWAIGASSTIQEEAGRLLAQAGDVAYDLSHSSVVDLSDGIVKFAGDAGALMLQSLEILGRAVTTSPIFS